MHNLHDTDTDTPAPGNGAAPWDFAYPRPQLVRAQWQSLNGPWRFAFDNERRYRLPSDEIAWTHDIIVPFPPESQASGVGDRGFHRACWYQREFLLQPGGPCVLLHFGAVDYQATVWLNGHVVARHEGGHTPFVANILSLIHI